MDGERSSGAALRRIERRLRVWQRHVRTAVQLALAEKPHHSANKVELDYTPRGQEKRAGREEAGLETHSGLRAPTPLPPGMRPAPLSEVAGPQKCDRTVRAPLLAANETLDSAALSFLLNRALEEEEERRKREEEQVKKQEDEEEVRRWLWTPMYQLTLVQRKKAFEHISKRKRKKRRKRKTPKTSSSRTVRTQNSGHSSASSSWYDYSGGAVWWRVGLRFFLVCTIFYSTAPIPYWIVLTAGPMGFRWLHLFGQGGEHARCCPSMLLCAPQLAEQLVEVRRSCPFLPCNGLWSSTSTFQFLVVEGAKLVFKVFPQNRVQHQRFLLQYVFLSGLWSRSSTFLFPVEAFTIFVQVGVHPLLRTFQLMFMKLWMSLVKGFFALFPKMKKVRSWNRARVRECPPVSVDTIPPNTEKWLRKFYMITMATVYSYENKCATNYSIIANNNWNDAYNMQLTKHDTNDDVDTMHLHFNGRVVYMH